MKLNKYTVPTGNWTPGCRMAVHYATQAPLVTYYQRAKINAWCRRLVPILVDNWLLFLPWFMSLFLRYLWSSSLNLHIPPLPLLISSPSSSSWLHSPPGFSCWTVWPVYPHHGGGAFSLICTMKFILSGISFKTSKVSPWQHLSVLQ